MERISVMVQLSPIQVCTLGERHLFLGSRLGNSLLLSYSKKIWNTGQSVSQSVWRPECTKSDWVCIN